MNLFSPELLVLSGRIALLVLVSSALALWIGRLLGKASARPAIIQTEPSPEEEPAPKSYELNQIEVRAEELRRNLAATEAQCVAALEQRDEAERQTAQRAEEVRLLKEALAKLKKSETASLAEHQSLVSEYEALKLRVQNASDAEKGMTGKLGELQTALDSARLENANLQAQLESKQELVTKITDERNEFRQKFAAAESSAKEMALKVAEERAESEQLHQDRLKELESKSAVQEHANPPAPLPSRSVHLPRPSLPPVEVLAAREDEVFESLPPAPQDTLPKVLREGLFDEPITASLSPDIPNLQDAESTLSRLEQALQEKDRLIGLLMDDHTRRQNDLEAVRHGPPEQMRTKLPVAEKAAHSAAVALSAANKDRDRCRRQVRALSRSLVLAREHRSSADDLTRIKGIKGGISQQLHAFGIFTYHQIVQWDAEDMQAFGELLAFKNRLHRDKWQEQAQTLIEAKDRKKATAEVAKLEK